MRRSVLAIMVGCCMAAGAAAQEADEPLRDAEQGLRDAEQALRVKAAECPDLFMALDADKNDRISAKEERGARERHFEAVDENQDGALARAEYVACLGNMPGFRSDMAQSASEAALPALWDRDVFRVLTGQDFTRVDADGSRVLSQAEFMAAAKAENALSGKTYGQSDAAAAAAWVFLRLDADGDGQVSAHEWTSHAEARQVVHVVFSALDADGDGQIGRDEYLAESARRNQFAARGGDADGLSVWDYAYWF